MRFLPFALAITLFVPTFARADLTLVQSIVSEGSTTRLTMKIKGAQVRVDSTPLSTAFIDTESGNMTNLIHPQKMIMRISGAQLKDMADAVKAASPVKPAPSAEPKATGRKETINGYATEEYVVDTPSGKLHLWLARDYPDWKEIVLDLARMSQGAWAKQLAGTVQADYDIARLPGLPLRTEMTQPGGGQVIVRFEAIDRKPIPPEEYAIPGDYKEIQMPAMGIPATAEP